MKNFLIVLVISILLSACASSRLAIPSAIGLVPLENYFVELNNTSDTGYNYKVITTQDAFEKEVQQGLSASPTRKPDFSSQVVVAVIHRTAPNQRTDLRMDSATMTGKQMQVYYHVAGIQKSPVTTYLPGLALATVPKAQSVKEVAFYEGGVLVKMVPVSIY